jgi:hypothetical protein
VSVKLGKWKPVPGIIDNQLRIDSLIGRVGQHLYVVPLS